MEAVKYCRICLEEGVLTSIFNTEFAMMPAEMIMLCAKVKIYKNDGMPGAICNNCIYRLGVAYHFKQQAENSDLRLRQYFNLMDKAYGTRDAEVNTETPYPTTVKKTIDPFDDDEEDDDEEESSEKTKKALTKPKSKRYKRKAPEERKKRGPKPMPRPPQTCYQCNKSFRCRAQLQLHIRTHSGEKPFACEFEFCNRRFAQKHNLTIHLRTHTGYKPYQCDVCSKQFSALGNFQQHKKIHDGIRDQVCPVCTKAFLTSGDLTRHIATHTGIKNHHCETCGKSFTRNRDMVAHQKKIHLNERPEETVKCPECHKVFATLDRLNEHFRQIHGAEPQQQPVAAPVVVVAPPEPPPPVPVPVAIHNQPGSIDHLLNNTPSIAHSSVGSSVAILAPPPPPPPSSGLGMIATHGQGHLGMMHHHPHQRIHPY